MSLPSTSTIYSNSAPVISLSASSSSSRPSSGSTLAPPPPPRPLWVPALPHSFNGSARRSRSRRRAHIPDPAHSQVFYLQPACPHHRTRRPCLRPRPARPTNSCPQAASISSFRGSTLAHQASEPRKWPATVAEPSTYVVYLPRPVAPEEPRPAAVRRSPPCPVISLHLERSER